MEEEVPERSADFFHKTRAYLARLMNGLPLQTGSSRLAVMLCMKRSGFALQIPRNERSLDDRGMIRCGCDALNWTKVYCNFLLCNYEE